MKWDYQMAKILINSPEAPGEHTHFCFSNQVNRHYEPTEINATSGHKRDLYLPRKNELLIWFSFMPVRVTQTKIYLKSLILVSQQDLVGQAVHHHVFLVFWSPSRDPWLSHHLLHLNYLKYPRGAFISAQVSAVEVKNLNSGWPESVPDLFSNGLSYAVKSHHGLQHVDPWWRRGFEYLRPNSSEKANSGTQAPLYLF